MQAIHQYGSLRKLFRVLAAGSLLAAVPGCMGIDPSLFNADLCSNGMYEPLAGVTPSMPVAYLSLREEPMFTDPMQAQPIVVVSTGTMCEGATRLAECLDTVARLRSSTGWSPPNTQRATRRYVVYTRGDEIGTITSLADLARFLSPIDTAADAALMVTEDRFRVPCGQPNARVVSGGVELRVQSGVACGAGTGIDEHRVLVSSTGTTTVLETVRIRNGDPNCAIGRRPEELHPTFDGKSETIGTYLTRMAALEALAVSAFERTVRELRHFDAPEALIEDAIRSLQEEVGHTAVVSALAEQFGGEGALVPQVALPVRGLFALALENAVEGCVRETYGAAQATYQWAHCKDAHLREALAVIADDETRHTELSWKLAAWIEPLLSVEEQALLRDAHRNALEALRQELLVDPSEQVQRVGGVPSSQAAIELYEALRATVWSGKTACA